MNPAKTIQQYQHELTNDKNGCQNAIKYFLNKITSAQHLNAFIEVYEEESIERSKELDSKRNNGKPLGKLHGVVVALKDVICYEGHKISAASNILKGFTSVYNSTVVKKLLAEDAIIIGNCNCDEFAMGSTNENSAYGKVLNALDETKVPGGSSGGSAVAVQAGLCMISLGSDTGGSVRQPADFCGIVGLKPTYGRISRYGLIAYASSFDQIGIFGNNIEDVALVLEAISGADEYDSTVSNKNLEEFSRSSITAAFKFAYFKNALNHPSLDPEIKKGIETLIEQLIKDGHTVKGIDFELLDYIVPAYYVLATAEASSNLSRYDGVRYGYREKAGTDLTDMYVKSRTKGFGKEVKRRIMLGTFVLSSGYYEAYFTKAQQVRKLLVEQTVNIFKDFDAILIPTAPSTAFTTGAMEKDPVATYLADIYTVFANLTGIPAIS
ncbi:MAG TPA: Asp-tRNA(Asn)/Glu-tRNA(Gln) amidotransferase subunit GatA, partial [Chitinophagaceae bacterium]|nr:Asp-tRNA(Asn)/Glu-tRNA(Gln) amidotransferase subunit GatA [Chitinophagaceae bacterium]